MENLSFPDLDMYLRHQKGKIIHQVWFGTIPNRSAAKETFRDLKRYRDSWLVKNPNWTHCCWSYDMCKSLMMNVYNEHFEMYQSYVYEIQRCDAVRYFILYRYGGVYADMDYFCNRPFDQALEVYQEPVYFVETPNRVGSDIRISNSLMYSLPNQPFWRKLFLELERNCTAPYYYGKHMTVMFTTGPGLLSRVYNKYKSEYKVDALPWSRFHPLSLSIESSNMHTDVYAIHAGNGSWESGDSKFFIFFYQEHKFVYFILAILLAPQIILTMYDLYNKWRRCSAA